MNLKSIFSIIILSVQVIAINAQGTATVKGTITDENGNPLFPATITIKDQPGGTTTDEKGNFTLKITAGQNRVIIISHLGFEPLEIPVLLDPGDTLELNKALNPTSENLEGVVIYGRPDRANGLRRISIKSLEYFPGATGGVEALLKTLPGVSSSNELSSQYSVRGGNFDENLIYVNDIEIHRPLLMRSGQQEGLSFINSDMISSVDFSAGGFEAQYGDKMSSVLDIKYKRPSEFEGSVSASLLGSAAHLEGISKNKKFTYNTGLRYKTTQYLLGTLETKGEYKPEFLDFQTYLTYAINDKLDLSVLGNLSINSYQFVPTVRETSFGTYQQALNLTIYYDGHETDRFLNYTGATTLNYKPNPKLSLKLIGSTFHSIERVAYDIQGQYWINLLDNVVGSDTYGDSILNIGVGTMLDHARDHLDAGIYTLSHKGTYRTNKYSLKWGLSYRYEDIYDKLNRWEMLDSAGYSLPYSGQDVNLYKFSHSNNHLYSSRIEGYLQQTFSFYTGRSVFYLNTGIRGNYWTFNHQFLVSPRVILTLDPHWKKELTFHFATGLYYQPPFFKELLDPEGKIYPDIKAQESIHYVLGSDFHFMAWDRPFIFTTELYYKDLHHLIPYKVENIRIQYLPQFSAKGYATGIEFKINGEFVKGAESWASLSLMRTREDVYNDSYTKPDGSTVYPGYYRRPTDQLMSFGLFFQDYLPNNPDYKVHLTLVYGSGLPYGSPDYNRPSENYSLGPYRRVDVGFSKALISEHKKVPESSILSNFDNIWISAEIFNLFGNKNKASYDWLRTVNNQAGQYNMFAVPNYLTGRRFNIRLSAKF